MPGLLYEPIPRRRFLRHAAQAVAALAVTGVGHLPAQTTTDRRVRLALLSDTHLPADPNDRYRGFFPSQNLKSILPQVAAAGPEAVFLNGDAARLTGQRADYEALKTRLAPLGQQVPIFIGLGNHDHRERFFSVFTPPPGSAQGVPGKDVLVVERPDLRFILLDSLFVTNQVAGLLGQAQRQWLQEYLARSDARTTILFVHHTLGESDTDLLDADRLFHLIRPHKKVKAIFYGHSHRYRFDKEGDVHLVNLPAVGYNFADSEPVGWVEAQFTPAGVELTLHALGGNRAQDGQRTTLPWSV